MATDLKVKLKDLYSPFSNPAGGLKVANSTPSTLLGGVLSGGSLPNPAADPLGLGRRIVPTYSTPTSKPAPAVVAAAPAAPAAPAYSAPAPVAPAPQQAQLPAQWMNPKGGIYSPEEMAANIAATLKRGSGTGDIGTLAANEFAGGNKSASDLMTEARMINNTRNDIAVGAHDPYKIASDSGIAYTPAELAAIEKAYAGVYDPALNTAFSKLEERQAADAAAAEAAAKAREGFTLGKDQIRYDANGNIIAQGISSTDGSMPSNYVAGANPTVDAFIQGLRGGTYKASDIPDEYKALVAQGMSATRPAISETARNAASVIDQITGNSDALLQQISGIPNVATFFPGTESQELLNLTKQLAGILSLDNREQLAGSGAISDFEFRVLQQAASALGIGDGGRTNLNIADFKSELAKLRLKLLVGETTLLDDELMELSKTYTPEQIRDFSRAQSFNGVGNTTASAGNVPQRNNNPGNVKSGGLADNLATGTDNQGHLVFPDAATGFKALTMDLTAKINGASRHLPANPTLAQLGKVYAEDPNWPVAVARMLGVPTDTPTKNIPIDQLAQAIARQEGFFA